MLIIIGMERIREGREYSIDQKMKDVLQGNQSHSLGCASRGSSYL